jgi:hypothetical protein
VQAPRLFCSASCSHGHPAQPIRKPKGLTLSPARRGRASQFLASPPTAHRDKLLLWD